MANGRVSGQVMMRPVRMGLLFGAKPASLQRAVEWATSTWGGIYSLLLDPTNGEEVLRRAGGFGVDALYPVDEDARSEALSHMPGYQWHGRGEWSPYAAPKEHMSARLLAPDWLPARLAEGVTPFVPHWSVEDQLADLFAVWFGRFASDEFGQRLASTIEGRGSRVEIPLGEELALPEGLSPVMLTAQEIEYTGQNGFCGFAVVDPHNATQLRELWNLRASGGDVFPWPTTNAHRLEPLARVWVEGQRNAGKLQSWRRGDGTDLPPHLSVALPAAGLTVPDELATLLRDCEITPFPEGYVAPPGWTGSHPLTTSFERSFSVEVPATDSSVRFPLPDFVPALRRDPIAGSMVVGVQIEIFHEQGLGSTRWATLPNVRALAKLLPIDAVRELVRRPVSGGRASALQVSSEECRLDIIPAMSAVAALFEGTGWECSQSDPGRFAVRLGDVFGGPGSVIANQPAVRATLTAAVRSPTGKTTQQLFSIAKRERGAGPLRLRATRTVADYSQEVVDFLTYRKLLQPYLAVRCPECAIVMTMRCDDLDVALSCSMCSAEFPLAYALAQPQARPIWKFRLPHDIGEDRLLEALALLATASAVGTDGVFAASSLYQFGVELKTPRLKGQSQGWECEVDVLMVIHDGGVPEIIVGEVKNQGNFEQDDLDKLLTVQGRLLREGFNCYPLFATLREKLRDDEMDALRAACERAPRGLSNRVVPLFPIVLVGADLSTAPFEDDHPRRWKENLGAFTNLSTQSCARNLGLQSVDLVSSVAGELWECKWGE